MEIKTITILRIKIAAISLMFVIEIFLESYLSQLDFFKDSVTIRGGTSTNGFYVIFLFIEIILFIIGIVYIFRFLERISRLKGKKTRRKRSRSRSAR